MDNIVDYVFKYGGVPFAEEPFCEVDSLILSQMSYYKYDGLPCDIRAETDGEITLRRLAGEKAFYDSSLFRYVSSPEKSALLLRAAAASARFGGIRLRYYENQFDAAAEKQFSAVTYLLDDTTAYAAFRGTDDSLVGWKEDFNMTFMPYVPAQETAAIYLDGVCREFDGRFLLGGHSKGGNLAEYAAISCAPENRERIIAVYNHDGPGFRDEVYAREGYLQVRDRIRKTVPKSSLVGLLLEQSESYRIVDSSRFGVKQHDPFSWKVQGFGFVTCEKISASSAHMKRTINDWLKRIDDDSRKLFIDTVYGILTATSAGSLRELRENMRENFRIIRKNTADLDEETKHFVLTTLGDFVRTFGSAFRKKSESEQEEKTDC